MSNSRDEPGVRLSVGADPIDGESLPGFVMRLASSAGFADARGLARMACLRQPASAVSDADTGKLARLAGTEPGRVAHLAYRPSGRAGHHVFLGGHVHREFLVIGHRRACPECLAESAHHRARWDLALVTACPDHRLRLAERCRACRARLGWTGPDPVRCRCGADVRTFTADRVRPEEASANHDVLKLADSGDIPWLPEPLAGCDRADLLRLVMCLGCFVTGWTRQRRIETLVRAGQDAVAAVVAAGVGALRDWPQAIHRHLSAQGDGADGRRGRYGARKTLGGFYDWMTGMDPGPVKDALAGAVAGYVSLDPTLSRRTHRSRLIGRAVPVREAVGLNEAAGLLGVSGERVKRMMVAGLLPEAPSEGRGVPMLIGRSAVAALADALPAMLDLAATAAALGVSKDRVRRLVDGGMLSPLHRARAGGWARWAFRPGDIASLLSALSPPPDVVIASARTVGFDHAAEALRRRGVDIAGLVAMVRQGRLPAARVDGSATGLKRLRFGAAAVRELCRSLEPAGSLTVQAAAERMGLKWQVVANLVGRGILHADGGRVSPADIDAFMASHVSGAELARERGTSPRALAAELGRRGILPVVGPAVDGSRQNIYRRRDIA